MIGLIRFFFLWRRRLWLFRQGRKLVLSLIGRGSARGKASAVGQAARAAYKGNTRPSVRRALAGALARRMVRAVAKRR
ncbi:MAG: hypothetical protein WBA12_16350 [Catalinimonas sp.]